MTVGQGFRERRVREEIEVDKEGGKLLLGSMA
jgi:hypothetical protein